MDHPPPMDDDAWRPEHRRLGLADVIAVAVWTAAVLVFFWDAVTLQKAFFYFDITEINFPYRAFLAREMQAGRFSRWCPGLYCGLPLYSESQAGYLHPLKFVFYPWMETWKAFNLDCVASVWLTGLGAYGWLRRHVGPRGALTGASIFGFSGFVWAHFVHTSMLNALTSVPFIMWALEWSWARGRTAGIALGAFALACQVFAGHLQDAIFSAALIGIYGAFRLVTESTWKPRLRAFLVSVAVIGLGMTLAAVQWIPSKELLDRSPRAGGLTWRELTYGSWHPELIPALVVREAYGTRARDTDWLDGFYPYHEMNAYLGITALVLAVIGGAACRDRWVAFWIFLAGLSCVLMLGRFTFVFDYANRIPIAGSSRIPVRFHLWLSLAAAALAGVGVDRLERGYLVRLRAPALLVVALVLFSLPIVFCAYLPAWSGAIRATITYHINRNHWLKQDLLVGTARTAVLGAIAALAIYRASRSRSGRVRSVCCSVLPLVVIADLLGSHWRDVPTIDPSYWTVPPASVAVLKAEPNLSRIIGGADKSAGEPGYASEYVDLFRVRDQLDWSLPPVWGLSSARGETPLISSRLLAFTDTVKQAEGRFDLQSVSHFLTGRIPRPGEGEPGTRIYVNPTVLPRARLIGRPMYAKDRSEAVSALKAFGAHVRDRLVVEDPDRPIAPDADGTGTARIVRDKPEHVEIETDSTSPAYLVLADTFDPGWSASVDGKAAPIRPAWVAFRAVALSSGRHRVVFSYRPAGFARGLSLSLAGLVAIVGLLFWPRQLPGLRPEHDRLAWPARWPMIGLMLIALLIAVSAVWVEKDGKVGLQSRWVRSFHQFTWGAGIEAMRQGVGKGAR